MGMVIESARRRAVPTKRVPAGEVRATTEIHSPHKGPGREDLPRGWDCGERPRRIGKLGHAGILEIRSEFSNNLDWTPSSKPLKWCQLAILLFANSEVGIRIREPTIDAD